MILWMIVRLIGWFDKASGECVRGQRVAGSCAWSSLPMFLALLIVIALGAGGAGAENQERLPKTDFTIDFSGYTGSSVDQWLRGMGFQFEKDAKDRSRLRLTVANGGLVLEALGQLRGFLLNDSVDVTKVGRVRIEWGIDRYPHDVSYRRHVNNEALMVYFFFGTERISSGHMLIPNSPYFIALFLCQDELTNVPYQGRYFHAGGRFVCVDKPAPKETIVSEFDLNAAFKTYFGKTTTPPITGIGLDVDTSAAGNGGKAAAFIKRIEFIDGARN